MAELFNTSLLNDANLKAYYRFEGNANDSSSLGSAGTNAGATFGTGMFGQGAAFGGSAHINVGNYGSIATFTANAWINVSVDPVIEHCVLGAQFAETAAKNIGLSAGGGYLSGTTVITTNRWYMATVTRSGTQGQIFVNGNFEASGTTDAFFSSTNFIGGREDVGDNPSYSMNGTIDDLAIFNRVLTPAEISLLYVAQAGLYASDI